MVLLTLNRVIICLEPCKCFHTEASPIRKNLIGNEKFSLKSLCPVEFSASDLLPYSNDYSDQVELLSRAL